MNKSIEQISTPIRWLLLFPISIIVTYLAGWLIHTVTNSGGEGWPSNSFSYVGAALAGLAYMGIALVVAYAIAPSFKKTICLVFGIFILGDMIAVHLILHANLLGENFDVNENDLSMLFALLRATDFENLAYGSLGKIGGAAMAGVGAVWALRSRKESVRRKDVTI